MKFLSKQGQPNPPCWGGQKLSIFVFSRFWSLKDIFPLSLARLHSSCLITVMRTADQTRKLSCIVPTATFSVFLKIPAVSISVLSWSDHDELTSIINISQLGSFSISNEEETILEYKHRYQSADH